MANIKHQAIAASAGSGKTFHLAHRYIRLLAGGVKPDRIIALTFSRKAAGEIFDSLVKYLSQAASSSQQAAVTGNLIGHPQMDQLDFLRLLRDLLHSLHRLHIGTLDSFTVGVIRAFPMELGIPSDFQLMDNEGASAKAARQEILGQIFNQRYLDRSAQQQFLEAFKLATFGQEEKGLERNLDAFISQYRGCYQLLPDESSWGSPEMIWPIASPWLQKIKGLDAIAEELLSLLGRDDLSESVMNRWTTFIDAVRKFDNRSPWSRDIEYLFEKLIEDIDDLRCGKATVRIGGRKGYDLSPRQSGLALSLLTHVMQTELHTALQRTRGIYRVLNQYEQFYDSRMRHQGKLTFDDVQHLLTPANEHSGGALLSRMAGQESRLYIDYRLDCRLDHWLLDEFQDTSDLQWAALSNLADEILQDTSGERSFFYVGDVKQAIYGWRGGNARLFGRILEQYEGLIEQRPMNTSFRSSQPIIDTVNRVFSSLPTELPSRTIREWQHIWQTHQCQKGKVPEHGYAALLEPDSCNGEIKPTQEDRFQIVAHLLKEIEPGSRGLSVGILVRKNDTGKELVDFLRTECAEMNIVHEGRGTIADNPVVAVLLSLVKFAAHPGDTLAWHHLQMSPLRQHLEKKGLDRKTLPLVLLREIQSSGFASFLRHWGAFLDTIHPLDDFGRKRLKDLIDAAGQFDSSGSRDCNELLRFIESYDIHELAAENAVRVMTIHQSKGLGFDVVILPDLQGQAITESRDIDLAIARDPETSQPLWALKMPRRIIARSDPVLAEQVQIADETACFDALCVQYVALTRAKNALYMITSFPGKTSTVINPAAFLKTQLGGGEAFGKPNASPPIVCLYETGERDWYTQIPSLEQAPQPTELPQLSKDFTRQASQRRHLIQISPSALAENKQNAGMLFDRAYRESLDFGTAMHELLAKVGWIEETDIEELIANWSLKSSAEAEFKRRVIEKFRWALSIDEVRQALAHPEANTALWREKGFEIVLDDKWVTGTFDRVVIVTDQSGKPQRATLIDFKSDEISNDDKLAESIQRYRPQLSLYAQSLSRMLGFDPSAIAIRLVFTGAGRVIDLPPLHQRG
ncbi:MAG: UvrD-helicase domain-containing protein [Dehalococcoidia bacterium]|nr:UvrD-helicase domain-containing protein [Dehalococcoidia bacterium]